MTVRVSGKNLAIGEALQDHAQLRIAAAVGRYFDGPISGHVVIETEGSGYRSDMTLHLQSGLTLQVDGRAHDPYPCFDQAVEKLSGASVDTRAGCGIATPSVYPTTSR